ncbi:hypothetical protein I7I48_01569 [Histoplasma ohiense]|nr:hypothetical protein I7I48_01569 [Histoplasma ohiense (nom. inval.)]
MADTGWCWRSEHILLRGHSPRSDLDYWEEALAGRGRPERSWLWVAFPWFSLYSNLTLPYKQICSMICVYIFL